MRSGDTRFINNSGLGLSTGNFDQGEPPLSANVPNIITGGVAQGNFMNWLEAKITNENAKILASPTLILGENPSKGARSPILWNKTYSELKIDQKMYPRDIQLKNFGEEMDLLF